MGEQHTDRPAIGTPTETKWAERRRKLSVTPSPTSVPKLRLGREKKKGGVLAEHMPEIVLSWTIAWNLGEGNQHWIAKEIAIPSSESHILLSCNLSQLFHRE